MCPISATLREVLVDQSESLLALFGLVLNLVKRALVVVLKQLFGSLDHLLKLRLLLFKRVDTFRCQLLRLKLLNLLLFSLKCLRQLVDEVALLVSMNRANAAVLLE